MNMCICSRGRVIGPFFDVSAAWSWFESRSLPPVTRFAPLVCPEILECLSGFFPPPKPSRRSRKIAGVAQKQSQKMDSINERECIPFGMWAVIKYGNGGAPEFVVGPFKGDADGSQWVSDNSSMVSSWTSYRIEPITIPEVFDATRRSQLKLFK